MTYIKSIFLFLIAATLIQQFMSQSTYLPYVKLVLGFVLMLLMMRPLNQLLHGNLMDLSSIIQNETKQEQKKFKEEVTKEYKENFYNAK